MAINLSDLTRTLVYQNQATIQAVHADTEAIRGVDRESEKLQNRWSWVAVLGGIVGAAGVVIGFVTGFGNPAAIGLLLVIGAFVLILGIAFRAKFARRNFADKRYELLHHLLQLLDKDTAAEAAVTVRLDLARPDTAQKFVSKGQVGYWKAKFFEDPWLQLTGRLLDGTAYSLTVVEKCQHRSRWKTSRSGKSKHKTKTKTATMAVLRLKPKPSKHRHLARLASDAADAVQLPSWAMLKSIEIEGGVLLLKASVKSEWSVPAAERGQPLCDGVQLIAMMFLSLYQVVNLSKVLTKAEPGAA